MAIIGLCGFETGDTVQAIGVAGTHDVQGTVKRTGAYALRCNPTTTGVGYVGLGGYNPKPAAYNAATAYYPFLFRYATKPASNSEPLFTAASTTGANKFHIRINSAGNLSAHNRFGTLMATGSTVLAVDTWYRIDAKVGTGASAAWEVRIDGVSEISGTGDLGIDPRKCKKGTVIVIVDKIQLYDERLYQEGIPIITASTRRIRPDMMSQKVKSLNYLNSILAKMEANLAGVAEALMLDADGFVAECTADNVFIVKRGALLTPASHFPILLGVTRKAVMELARKAGVEVEEVTMALQDVYTADECFLTGTGAELIPVIKVDGRPIGDGRPGPLTGRLLELFRKLRTTEGTQAVP